MSKIEVNEIVPQSGTTLTIGETGDTISFASGVLPSLESLTITGDLTVDTSTLKVDSTNNRVGIGTASPSSLLHLIQTSDDTDGGLQIRNSADSNSVFIYQDGTTTTFDSGSGGDQAFRLGNAERMRITQFGNVGIGTSSPSFTLDVDSGSSDNTRLSDTTTSSYATTNGGMDVMTTLSSTGTSSTQSTGIRFTLIKSGETNALSEIGAIRISSGNSGLVFRTRDNATGVNERMRIDQSGNVGIGTSSPSELLHISGAVNKARVRFDQTGSPRNNFVGLLGDADQLAIAADESNIGTDSYIVFRVDASEAVRIDSSGNVGIGTSSTDELLDVAGNMQVQGSSGSARIYLRDESSGTPRDNYIGMDSYDNLVLAADDGNVGGTSHMTFKVDGSEQMRINDSGRLGIGTSSPAAKLDVNGSILASGTASSSFIEVGRGSGGVAMTINDGGGNANLTFNHRDRQPDQNGNAARIEVNTDSTSSAHIEFEVGSGVTSGATTSLTKVFEINESGVVVTGSLSKSSGSFRIPHPLSSKTNTNDLVHSFVEAPQADNIYRGKVDLVNGTATVNIDTVAGMSEGTFILLNREIQCFTSNETGWTAVRGSVSGNILTITAQDETCTDTISWLVIGERQDQHMYDTEWTDENGKVIVEPLKPVEEELTLENE